MKEQQIIIELQSNEQIVEKSKAQLYFESLLNAPYNIHNGLKNQKSWRQILTVILFILQVVFHSVYVAPYIYQINNEILNFIFILNYFIMCAVIGHFVYLSINDPVDSLIVDIRQRETVQKNSKQQTVFCIMCQKTVKKTSKHCYQCGRCTEEYDHHCYYINNCIGLGNYQQFIRLLLFYQLYNILTTVQSIWVVTKSTQISSNKGGNIFLIILNVINFILIFGLLIFHCYLNCYIKKPTFQFWKDHKKRKYQVADKLQQKNYLGDVLGFALKKKPGILDKQLKAKTKQFQAIDKLVRISKNKQEQVGIKKQLTPRLFK